MRSVLSFRFALLGSLGLLHACGARSTGGASATQIGDGKGDPQDEPTAPLGMQPPPVKPAIAPDLPAPIHPTPAPTPVPTLTTPPVAGLLDSVCPPPERESQFGAGLFECRNGMVHREVAIDCGPVPDEEPLLIFPSSPISASSIGDGGVILGDAGARTLDVSACEKNADCVSKNNGRCRVYNEGNDIRTRCEYPCVTDSDCSPQEVCECHGDIRDCVYAHCRTDAECAPGHACARYVFNECGSAKQYACTTDADGCHTAQDCGFEDNPRIAGCVPHSNGGAQCDSSECIEGRPFLVSGVARTAAVVERTDWTSPIVVDLTRLDTEQCLYLSEHWARIGQMEHASIAAFARFALQLLSVGAPPELLSATNAAMVDETLHARLAFGLASVYRGHALGPAALDCTGALSACDLESIVMGTLQEGCIGETLAALDAKRALERCEDPAISAVLETIVRDETRHAELAWKFVQWAFEVDPSLASKALAFAKSEHETARSEHRAQSPSARQTSWPSRYGVTSRTEQVELHAQVLEQVVVPCLTALAVSGKHTVAPATTQTVSHVA